MKMKTLKERKTQKKQIKREKLIFEGSRILPKLMENNHNDTCFLDQP